MQETCPTLALSPHESILFDCISQDNARMGRLVEDSCKCTPASTYAHVCCNLILSADLNKLPEVNFVGVKLRYVKFGYCQWAH